MKVRDVIRRIENDGWEFKRQRGSHPHLPSST
jgi:predicted RNA binding protein YcfA (HicA-like mRNA interferase family)